MSFTHFYMSVALLFAFIFAFQTIYADNIYKEEYYDQYIDHFNFYKYKDLKFKQRYLYDDQFYDAGRGPLLFYTGNEGDITSFWKNTGFMFNIAQILRGLVVFGEHRFYGKSLPFGNNSFDQSHIGLLSIDQALADFAELIRYLFFKFKLNPVTPVIAFGGSYGGILSAYMRFKYPNVIDGAIAASAPLLSIANLTPRKFFFKHITKVFNDIDPKCVAKIKDGFAHIKDSQNITKSFKLCKDLNSDQDINQFFGWLRNAFVLISMLNYPYETNFITKLPKYPVKTACDLMLQNPSAIDGLYQIGAMVYKEGEGKDWCHDIHKEYVACSDPTGCGLGSEGVAWDFQACTDLILPEGSDNKTDMFPRLPFTLDDRTAYCELKWDLVPRNERLALSYWGANIGASSNIIFSNGDLDPWSPGGISKNYSDSLIALTVQGGAHHLDLRGARDDDIPSVVTVRKIEFAYIERWINETLSSGVKKFENYVPDSAILKMRMERRDWWKDLDHNEIAPQNI